MQSGRTQAERGRLRFRVLVILAVLGAVVLYTTIFAGHSEMVVQHPDHVDGHPIPVHASDHRDHGEEEEHHLAEHHGEEYHKDDDSAAHHNDEHHGEEAAEKKSSQIKAVIRTDHGPLTFILDAESAPKTVANFVRNAKDGTFDDSCFYRYEANFVLQGGLHCKHKMRGSSHTVPLEYKRPNARGTISMARTSDPNSGTTEFFINLVDNGRMLGQGNGGGYAVFGELADEASWDTISDLQKLPTKKEGLTMYVAPQPRIKHIRIEGA